MQREMKLLLIEIDQLRTEVEQLRAKEEEAQNVKDFLYRALAIPCRPGVRVIAKQFGVDPGTQRISRPFDRVSVVAAV